jgi:hypothetical protein
MTRNIGNLDRALRVIVGLALSAYAIPIGFSATGWNWVGWIGIVPILTAAFGTCPAYSILGMTTCGLKSKA